MHYDVLALMVSAVVTDQMHSVGNKNHTALMEEKTHYIMHFCLLEYLNALFMYVALH